MTLPWSLARRRSADLVIANDPDADRLAAVVPHDGDWRPLTGNEIGSLLGDYMLAHDPDPARAVVVSSIVSSPMLGRIASSYGAMWERTLTGFKWIVKAGLALEGSGERRFIFGYEEALGYTVGSTVRDKDGIGAAVVFTDLAADLADEGLTLMDRLHRLWEQHGLWVSAQVSITRPGPNGVESLRSRSRGAGRRSAEVGRRGSRSPGSSTTAVERRSGRCGSVSRTWWSWRSARKAGSWCVRVGRSRS